MSVNSELMRLVIKMGGEVSEEDSNSDLLAKIVDLWEAPSLPNESEDKANVS